MYITAFSCTLYIYNSNFKSQPFISHSLLTIYSSRLDCMQWITLLLLLHAAVVYWWQYSLQFQSSPRTESHHGVVCSPITIYCLRNDLSCVQQDIKCYYYLPDNNHPVSYTSASVFSPTQNSTLSFIVVVGINATIYYLLSEAYKKRPKPTTDRSSFS